MPGPAEVGQSRSVTVRGILTAFLVFALVAGVGTVLLTVRHDRARSTSPGLTAEEATLRLVPAPGTTATSTCTDPVSEQEWRVTWQAVAAATTTPTAQPTTAKPTAKPTAGRTGAADLATQLTERAAAVILKPIGFAVRPLPGVAPAKPTATSATPEASASPGLSPSSGVSPSPTLTGGWQPRDADPWLLRWSPTLTEAASAAPGEEWERVGPLATLAPLGKSVRQDPRYVTPDGGCSVYLAPFVSGTAGTRNSVAVVGDSLVAQLGASEDGTATGAGWLMRRLMAAGDRAEIVGQSGRRWTIKPDDGFGLQAADASLLDEIRGVRESRSVVIALGTNDAGWAARAPDQEQYELRMAWVLLHLAPILDELRDHGHCTVLTTMATRNKVYIDTVPGRFEAAASRINAYLHERADADPHDRLRLWDWDTRANGHGTTDPEPWFGDDTIHLNQAGRAAYADALAAAAKGC